MLCWVYIVDGVRAGRCAASAATTWAPSSEESLKWSESDGLPSLEISLESVEGHRLNGRDVLSRKAGLRLGKDSTGVEASPNQDKLRRMNKYCRLQGLNRCPLAWELGTLPLDHLGFDSKLPLLKVRGKTVIYIYYTNVFWDILAINKKQQIK